MKIFISKTYQKWVKANKGEPAVLAIEKFLCRVFNSTDITNVTPASKPVGNELRKAPGVVDEFALNKKYRVYAKCLEFQPGSVAFYLATAGSKGNKGQNDDILKALEIFDDITATEWENWEPSPAQMKAFANQKSQVIADIPQAPSMDTVPAQKTTGKKKGKPVDENGLTVAERKKLRKQEEAAERKRQEEKRKQIKEAEEAQKRQLEQEEEQKRLAAAAANQAKATDTTAETDKNNNATPVVHNVVSETPTKDKPMITLNGAPVSAPTQTISDVTFQDVARVQYELELIEHQINIEKLQMEIVRQNIAMAQHEIALEQLKIKQLKLLQMQKTQNIQK